MSIDNQIDTLKIISVSTVTGDTLKQHWRSNMQIIETDKGRYIDNIPNVNLTNHSAGYNWSAMVGKTISGINVINNSGYNWLSKK